MKHALKHPDSVFFYVKTVMTTYAPPNAPPAVVIGTVAEEGEEEEETAHDGYWLYVDIETKMENVRDELMRSGNNAECLTLVLRTLQFWPEAV